MVSPTYSVALFVLGRVNASACCTTGTHSLVPVLAEMEFFRLFSIMHALDDFWSDERALGHDALERHHVVKMARTERSRIAGKLSKAADVCTIVDLELSTVCRHRS